MSKRPELTPIKSSMFTGQHYNPSTRQLTVQFKNGSVHQYEDVPAEKHNALTGNASPGRYFNENIKNNFAGKKLSEGGGDLGRVSSRDMR